MALSQPSAMDEFIQILPTLQPDANAVLFIFRRAFREALGESDVNLAGQLLSSLLHQHQQHALMLELRIFSSLSVQSLEKVHKLCSSCVSHGTGHVPLLEVFGHFGFDAFHTDFFATLLSLLSSGFPWPQIVVDFRAARAERREGRANDESVCIRAEWTPWDAQRVLENIILKELQTANSMPMSAVHGEEDKSTGSVQGYNAQVAGDEEGSDYGDIPSSVVFNDDEDTDAALKPDGEHPDNIVKQGHETTVRLEPSEENSTDCALQAPSRTVVAPAIHQKSGFSVTLPPKKPASSQDTALPAQHHRFTDQVPLEDPTCQSKSKEHIPGICNKRSIEHFPEQESGQHKRRHLINKTMPFMIEDDDTLPADRTVAEAEIDRAIQSLRPGCRLNATAFGLCLRAMNANKSHDNLTFHPVCVSTISQETAANRDLREFRIHKHRKLFIPLHHLTHDGIDHWTLGVIDTLESQYLVYDPSPSNAFREASVQALRAFLPVIESTVPPPSPRTYELLPISHATPSCHDDVDCGIYALFVALSILYDLPKASTTYIDAQIWRLVFIAMLSPSQNVPPASVALSSFDTAQLQARPLAFQGTAPTMVSTVNHWLSRSGHLDAAATKVQETSHDLERIHATLSVRCSTTLSNDANTRNITPVSHGTEYHAINVAKLFLKLAEHRSTVKNRKEPMERAVIYLGSICYELQQKVLARKKEMKEITADLDKVMAKFGFPDEWE